MSCFGPYLHTGLPPRSPSTKYGIGIGQWCRFYNDRRPHQALGYKTPAAAWAAEVSPVDLPLCLDDADASPTTPQGQQQQTVIHSDGKEERPSPYEPTPMVPRLGSTAANAI